MSLVQRIKLGDLSQLVTKGTTPTSVGLSFSDSGVPFLRIQNLNNKSISLKDVLFIDADAHKALKRSVIKPGDLLITIAGSIGKVAIVPNNFPECNCNQAIAIIRFDNSKLHHEYLFHWLHTHDALQQITGKKVTATISNLSLGQIKNLEIPLPPLAEQKQIAAILDAADSLRQKDQQLLEHYTALSQSLFLEMFGEPISNPGKWTKVPLEELVSRVIDCPHSTPKWTENGVVAVRTSNLTRGGWSWEDKRFVSEQEFHERSKRAYVSAGDIILSREGTIGVAAIVTDEMKICLGQRLVQLIPNLDTANNYYLLHLLLYELAPERIGKVMVGATSKHLNVKELRSLRMIAPPLERQNQFAERITIIEQQKQQAQANLEKSEALFNSLLQRAFTGELTTDKAA